MRAPIGQIDVDARAEADQAEAVARAEIRAFVDEADDAPRDQAGDLHDAERARRALDDDAVALVVLARLVEIGVEEQAGLVGDARHAALDRRAVHVAVEHRHEDRNALHRLRAEAEFGRRRRHSRRSRRGRRRAKPRDRRASA